MSHIFSRLGFHDTAAGHTLTRHTQRIFDVYNVFRLLLALVLLVSFIFATPDTALGAVAPELFHKTSLFYVAANFLVFFRGFLWRKYPLRIPHYAAIITLDIIVLTILSYSCGGVSSGMSSLLIVPVAAGAVLIPGILSLFLAAIGSIAIIYSEIYFYLSIDNSDTYYVQAGLLGTILFATAFMFQVLSRRIRQSEILAQQQTERINYLQKLNEQIIQRMATGLVVIDEDNRVLITNDSARKLLQFQGQPEYHLPTVLLEQLDDWKNKPFASHPPFRLQENSEQLQARFAWLNEHELNDQEKALALIFLENHSLLSSHVQQLKLVSLGRLTASIAHEIRNPLGAISHASQLLSESDTIAASDLRLTEIIQNHSKRIDTLISSILELSRSRNNLPEQIQLGPWLENFTEVYKNSHPAPADITLHIPADELPIRFNDAQLQQVLTNLYENGLRHSTQHTGKASLIIQCGVDSSTEAPYLTVIDQGAGISPADQEKIFEPFYTTEPDGTGLGLYICREICEAHHTRLGYNYSLATGSCFRISFIHPDKYIT